MHSQFPLSRRAPGAVLLLASLAALALAEVPRASASGGPATTNPESAAWLAGRWARTDLEALASAARRWRDEHGAWPADCFEAARTYLQPPPKLDPWGSPYACRHSDGQVAITSPGPDGRSGTSDDLAIDAAAGGADAPTPPGATPPGAPAQPPPPVVPASAEEAATARSLAAIAGALESFRAKEGRYPVADKVEHLEPWLVSEHLASAAWTTRDAWGRPLRYRTTDVGSSYTLSSAGSDGRWESLDPGSAVPAEGADLALADGVPVRWPATLAAGLAPPSPAASPASEAEPPRDPFERTRQRLERLAGLVAQSREGGRFIESDDAERLARELGADSATDGWGRPLHYLSADGGQHFALVSAGPDGRLEQAMEAYSRGARPAGDDLVAHDGRLVQ